ncbi:hypothetical protein GYMLUDRAFT_781224 [Collybiopsis luxurians FD-317 M1]|uniref:Uncharacterized protein n=1 Tax=Collybiopsis luxurians FD-317 M1 TaxID=944289 RepID=A0A0D0B0T6_9AGAR|nr:hypothetical protein GYMLUDRAFT_781224 [Collybiopsis luxurians FD-317 M1]
MVRIAEVKIGCVWGELFFLVLGLPIVPDWCLFAGALTEGVEMLCLIWSILTRLSPQFIIVPGPSVDECHTSKSSLFIYVNISTMWISECEPNQTHNKNGETY